MKSSVLLAGQYGTTNDEVRAACNEDLSEKLLVLFVVVEYVGHRNFGNYFFLPETFICDSTAEIVEKRFRKVIA